MTAPHFRALGGLTLTVGPESQDGLRHIAVEADDKNGSLERLGHITNYLVDRRVATLEVGEIDYTVNPDEGAVKEGLDLHVIDATVTPEIIEELGTIMPVVWTETSVVQLQAA